MSTLSPAIPVEARQRLRLGIVTRGVQRVQTLAALLPDWQLVPPGSRQRLDAVLAWGQKPSAAAAEAHARRDGLPLIRVEDGFLRSVGLGHQCPPLSLVVDELGIYYDASAPSRLERLIAQPIHATRAERAQRLRAAWVEARVSKYNHVREPSRPLHGDVPPVLVIDQTAGDMSIRGAGAAAADFHAMLQAALDEHPRSRVLLKVHPDVIAGRKRGHFDALTPGQAARVDLLADDIHPPALLQACAGVYVVSSQMGFEALLWQRPVRCFGMPFYAGWGLTQDAKHAPARRRPASLEALVDAALVQYPRYLDPETGGLCSPERLIEHLALQRRMRARFPAALQAIGFSRWKRPIARAFFDGSTLEFRRRVSTADAKAPTVATWGRKPVPDGTDAPLVRVEDGFIRSVGLGADFTRPVSWVQDDLGIYFDASRPSRLEQILSQHAFDAALRRRAASLRAALVDTGITKYNVGHGGWRPPPDGRRVVLVPGQVEGDASLAWGGCAFTTNLELLRAARQACHDAYLVYKPHPDVLAGLRDTPQKAGAALEAARALCDEIVTDVPMGQLLPRVDAVHTMTSLTGFEALLRGKSVVAWGMPFYAGWGLTQDHADAQHPARQRRTRCLTLDELVAGTLILYPAYVSRHSGCFTTPERALLELQAWQRDGAALASQGAWRRWRRRLLHWAARWRRA